MFVWVTAFETVTSSFCSCHSALPGGSRCRLPSSSVEGALQTASISSHSWSLFPSSAFSLFIKQIENESNRSLQAWTLLHKTGKGFTHMSLPGESQPIVLNWRLVCGDYQTQPLTFTVGFSTWTWLAGWYLGLYKPSLWGCTAEWLSVSRKSTHSMSVTSSKLWQVTLSPDMSPWMGEKIAPGWESCPRKGWYAAIRRYLKFRRLCSLESLCLLQGCLLCTAMTWWGHLFIQLTFGKHLFSEDRINEMRKQGRVKVPRLAIGHRKGTV